MLDQQVLEEIYIIAEKVGAHQVLTEREQAMYDDILEDAGYYQAFCLYTAMIDFRLLRTVCFRKKNSRRRDGRVKKSGRIRKSIKIK